MAFDITVLLTTVGILAIVVLCAHGVTRLASRRSASRFTLKAFGVELDVAIKAKEPATKPGDLDA